LHYRFWLNILVIEMSYEQGVGLLGVDSLFLAGLLAGEELVVRLGVRGPVAQLMPEPHIRLRQGLIRSLRLFVPSLYFPTLVTGLAVALLGGGGPGLVMRLAAIASLVIWLVATLGGTAPINQAVLRWDAEAPPEGWQRVIGRWERLDTLRTVAAVAAFAFLPFPCLTLRKALTASSSKSSTVRPHSSDSRIAVPRRTLTAIVGQPGEVAAKILSICSVEYVSTSF